MFVISRKGSTNAKLCADGLGVLAILQEFAWKLQGNFGKLWGQSKLVVGMSLDNALIFLVFA